MTDSALLLGPLLQCFFAEHLVHHKRASPQTVACYRDTFRLLLEFLQKQRHIEPSALRVTDLDAPTVLSFLDYLEQERKNSVRSRNLRLAAIRSFFRLVALREPSHVDLAARILAIPVKRAERKLVGYLTRLEVEAILAAPDLSKWQGRRDYALLLTLYNSGARVSELIRLETSDVRFGSSNFVSIFGKGRKQRTVPLWNKTARVLRKWFIELQAISTTKAFPNARGSTLSRDGVNYILQLAIQRAAATCPSLSSKRISPHTLRHSTAMHLLQSGVDITVIALWLGHESIETTHGYIEADLRMKEKALEKTTPHPGRRTRFKASDSLLRFLAQL
jgi:integrase/recombinase XerD